MAAIVYILGVLMSILPLDSKRWRYALLFTVIDSFMYGRDMQDLHRPASLQLFILLYFNLSLCLEDVFVIMFIYYLFLKHTR